jgi:hypothetical protein
MIDPKKTASAVPGLAVIGCFVVGIIGIVNGASGNGIALFSAAIVFSVLVFVLFRK